MRDAGGIKEALNDVCYWKHYVYLNARYYEKSRRKDTSKNNIGSLKCSLMVYYLEQEPDFHDWFDLTSSFFNKDDRRDGYFGFQHEAMWHCKAKRWRQIDEHLIGANLTDFLVSITTCMLQDIYGDHLVRVFNVPLLVSLDRDAVFKSIQQKHNILWLFELDAFCKLAGEQHNLSAKFFNDWQFGMTTFSNRLDDYRAHLKAIRAHNARFKRKGVPGGRVYLETLCHFEQCMQNSSKK